MPEEKISFTDGIIQVIAQMGDTFVLVCIVFIILSWIRLVVDNMSGRGL